jgi:protein CpxP
MTKNTILYVLLAFLIIANGFFLYDYLGKPDRKGPRNNPQQFIVKELNFNADQMQEFKGIGKNHRERMIQLNQEQKQLKDQLFSKISENNINPLEIERISSLIGENNKNKDLEVFNHFRAIQEICNDPQKQKFKKIVMDALHKGPSLRNGGGPRNQNQAPPPRN